MMLVDRALLEEIVKRLEGKIDDVLEKQDQVIAQQAITNGKVQRHEVQITRIWAVGSTAWGILLALAAYTGLAK